MNNGKKWLPKKKSWSIQLAALVALLSITLYASKPNFAQTEAEPSQGEATFFGKYEEPKPSPAPDPKPEPGVLPDSNNTSQDSGKKGSGQFPMTGTVVKTMTLPGVLVIGIVFLLFIIKNRKKKKEN